MILRSVDARNVFTLGVLDYQFPDTAHDLYDSNWLTVQISAQTPELSWSSVDPCLLAWESHWLLNWLSDLALGIKCDAEMSFMECTLKFLAVSRNGADIVLLICVQEGLRPPNPNPDASEQFEIRMEVSASSIQAAVNEFSGELRSFPTRAGASWPCRPTNDRQSDCVLCGADHERRTRDLARAPG